MPPIFHLSIPVRDLDASLDFYRAELGAHIGRRTGGWADALVFGAQVTLQLDPGNVSDPMPRTRHFGATVGWDEWVALAERFESRSWLVEPPAVSHQGQPTEQAKLMVADPSGNLIEIKAYRHPDAVLGPLAR